jgi:hypothetical protein
MDPVKQLSLDKGGQRYVFRYQSGNEAEVIGAMASLAGDQNTDFDWFDAAVLSYQMGRRIEMEIDSAATDRT